MKQQNMSKVITLVTKEQLPLSCPLPNTELWDMHPRVFLPIEKEESRMISCPYCGAKYSLE